MGHRNVIAAVVLSLTLLTAVRAEDWPAFRGPNGTGISRDKGFPTTWSAEKNIKWKQPLPHAGNGSPIVSAGRVFVTCAATNRGAERSLFCFDRKDGKQLWVRTVKFKPDAPTHKTNPYCGTTPLSDGSHVVVWHGSAGMYCYDHDGRKLWNRKLGTVGHIWGYGSSPIRYLDMLVLNFGPGVETFLVALDIKTGNVVWKTNEPGGANSRDPRMVGSWSTPVLAKVDGKDQLICSMPTRVVAYDPDSGKILWTCGGLASSRGDLVYTSPIVGDEFGVAMGGYKGPSLGFRLGGSGDVTETHRLWHQKDRQPQRIGSGVVLGEHVYMANAGPGTIQCLELETGRQLWQERSNANHWGSVVLADGNLYATNQDGMTTVFHPNPKKFELVAKNKMGESTNATPAFSDGEIFLRTDQHVYGIAE